MSDPWDGPGGQATRSRTGRVPEQRAGASGGAPRPGGRAAARAEARSHGGKRSRRRARPVRRGRRVLKIVGMCLAMLVLATAGAGWWFYQHLNGNINSVSLDGKGGSEKADAFGRTPINILVMGSDGRTSKADCKLGGGCSQTGVQTGNGNADVQMVVHISADRSNATVMSIPRDTMVDVPACKDTGSGQSTPGYYGQINSALQYGPACQVATIHRLTGIPIDHFVKLDFSGVVKMSDAVGGVSVCVDHNVYDTYSHLKLSSGSHTLKGEAALEFVRSRHGFGDGSDLGRTVSQHIFLSAMIRKFKSAGTLTDPTAVYDLADAATKALTVDDGLGSVKKLIGLAADVNKVPTKRMTFTTMQTAADPNDTNRVVVGAGAKALFSSIADDQSLTTGSGKKSTAASATATASAVPASEIAVTVKNGTEITGRASAIANALTGQGFSSATTTANAPSPATTTTLTYGTGRKAAAQTAAKALGLSTSHLKEGTGTGLTLVIGSDWTSGTTYPGGSSSPAPADTKAAVSNAHAQTADEAKKCAKVSPYKTVALNGVAMTPEQAYAASPHKKDSDE
ncbi:LCP family protein [Streptomyces sp. NBC_00882]|uniref:LCP family protein n=1 Tax=Streptomyces sp. NBC_00882 TaxID=2975856 RepID=UPI00386EBB9C|nr:LCP family protein [Streptomyces sp. NBC_00882]